MANAFTAALDTIFADPNFGTDATYMGPVGAVPVTCRVMILAPDENFAAGFAVSAPARRGEIRASEIAKVEENAILTVDGREFRIQGVGQPDAQRLVWRFGLVPVRVVS